MPAARCCLLAVGRPGRVVYPTENIPTLVLSGGLDPATPPAFGNYVASQLKTAYTFTLADSGHRC